MGTETMKDEQKLTSMYGAMRRRCYALGRRHPAVRLSGHSHDLRTAHCRAEAPTRCFLVHVNLSKVL